MKYYCAKKFNDAEVKLYDGTVSSCCKASPVRIPISEITKHPAGFFNNSLTINERERMLAGEKLSSCDYCWQLEDRGLDSPRRPDNIITDLINKPKTLQISTSNTCNLTCVYCDKSYSSAWQRDFEGNGSYDIGSTDIRFNITNLDKVYFALSQKQLLTNKYHDIITQQLKECTDLDEVNIVGGEPLLYSELNKLVDSVIDAKEIVIYSGLGVSNSRLKTVLNTLSSDIKFVISAETVGKYYEFNRYGHSYANFKLNFDTLRAHTSNIAFNCVLGNTTLLGHAEFLQHYGEYQRTNTLLKDPGFMQTRHLDDRSKDVIAKELGGYSELTNTINSMSDSSDGDSRKMLSKYLAEFARRRNLRLQEIFPDNFIDWFSV
jgi:organic radical activating enzyme